MDEYGLAVDVVAHPAVTPVLYGWASAPADPFKYPAVE